MGLNGLKAMIIDIKITNPDGWRYDKSPQVSTPNEAIIYEAHVRDLSVHPESGINIKISI